MIWRKDKPTQPGFYFYREHERDDHTICELIEINQGHDAYVHWLGISDGDYLCEIDGGDWSGPLVPPIEYQAQAVSDELPYAN